MRTYGKVHTAFWTDPKTSSLPGDAQRLAIYLLSGPHSNSIGCFRLPLAYLMDDLHFSQDEAAASLSELERVGFIIRCHSTGWTLIVKFLRHNPPENGKVGKSMLPLIAAVPVMTPVWAGLVEGLSPHAVRFPDGYVIRLLALRDTVSSQVQDTVSPTRSDRVCDTVWHTLEHKSGTPEPEPEPLLSQEDIGGSLPQHDGGLS